MYGDILQFFSSPRLSVADVVVVARVVVVVIRQLFSSPRLSVAVGDVVLVVWLLCVVADEV